MGARRQASNDFWIWPDVDLQSVGVKRGCRLLCAPYAAYTAHAGLCQTFQRAAGLLTEDDSERSPIMTLF